MISTPLNKKKTFLVENLNVYVAYLHRKSKALHPSSHRHSGPSHCPCAGGISAWLGPLRYVSGTAEYGPWSSPESGWQLDPVAANRHIHCMSLHPCDTITIWPDTSQKRLAQIYVQTCVNKYKFVWHKSVAGEKKSDITVHEDDNWNCDLFGYYIMSLHRW